MTVTLVYGNNKGDQIYYDDSDQTWHIVSGNLDNTRRFWRYVSIGGVYQAPAWDTLIASDLGTGAADNYALVISPTTHVPTWMAQSGGGSGSWARPFAVMGA